MERVTYFFTMIKHLAMPLGSHIAFGPSVTVAADVCPAVLDL